MAPPTDFSSVALHGGAVVAALSALALGPSVSELTPPLCCGVGLTLHVLLGPRGGVPMRWQMVRASQRRPIAHVLWGWLSRTRTTLRVRGAQIRTSLTYTRFAHATDNHTDNQPPHITQHLSSHNTGSRLRRLFRRLPRVRVHGPFSWPVRHRRRRPLPATLHRRSPRPLRRRIRRLRIRGQVQRHATCGGCERGDGGDGGDGGGGQPA